MAVTHVSVDATNVNTGSWCFSQESSLIEVMYRSSGQQSQHLRVTCVCLCNRSLNCPSCRLWFHSPRWFFTVHAFKRRLLFIFWKVWTRRLHEGAITCRSLHVKLTDIPLDLVRIPVISKCVIHVLLLAAHRFPQFSHLITWASWSWSVMKEGMKIRLAHTLYCPSWLERRQHGLCGICIVIRVSRGVSLRTHWKLSQCRGVSVISGGDELDDTRELHDQPTHHQLDDSFTWGVFAFSSALAILRYVNCCNHQIDWQGLLQQRPFILFPG